jgi:hypothetical protein
MIKIRKVVYNNKGYQKGILLPTFIGDIHQAFDFYSGLWVHQHTDKKGLLVSTIDDRDVDMMTTEFMFKDEDNFFIGVDKTFAYEGISKDYEGFGCELDEHGFELMKDSLGNVVPYTSIKMETL